MSANQSDKLAIEGKNVRWRRPGQRPSPHRISRPFCLPPPPALVQVVFTPNSENQQRPKKFKENISFDQMLGLVNFLASS